MWLFIVSFWLFLLFTAPSKLAGMGVSSRTICLLMFFLPPLINNKTIYSVSDYQLITFFQDQLKNLTKVMLMHMRW